MVCIKRQKLQMFIQPCQQHFHSQRFEHMRLSRLIYLWDLPKDTDCYMWVPDLLDLLRISCGLQAQGSSMTKSASQMIVGGCFLTMRRLKQNRERKGKEGRKEGGNEDNCTWTIKKGRKGGRKEGRKEVRHNQTSAIQHTMASPRRQSQLYQHH